MSVIAVTGPRRLSRAEHEQALADLKCLRTCERWLVGDAPGLDELARLVCWREALHTELYQVKPQLPDRARYAERSTRMVSALAQVRGTLHAWPNKPAPPELRPSRNWPRGAQGSGTWGTIALAVGLGLNVELHPLMDDLQLPDWIETRQLAFL
jgi:hypothetical protein